MAHRNDLNRNGRIQIVWGQIALGQIALSQIALSQSGTAGRAFGLLVCGVVALPPNALRPPRCPERPTAFAKPIAPARRMR
jgi:hypothetical protein